MKEYILSHRFFALSKEAQEKSKNQIELILLVKTLMEKIEILEEQVKYLNTQTQVAQAKIEQDIYRIQQKI